MVEGGLDRAINLAVSAHCGQLDKGGQPYILHPLRVMLACKTDPQRIAAVLHDTVEDGGVELNLIRHWFGQDIADAVDALSRRSGEDYAAFIERCAANDIARTVKLADLRDNMDMSRLGREPTIEDARRQWKYGDAVNVLMTADFAAQATPPHPDTTPGAEG